MNTATLPAARNDGIGVFEGDPALGWAARLREALAASDAPALLLVAPGAMPDAFTVGQMAAALEAMADVDAVSPVSTDAVSRAWELDDDADPALEAWTWAPHIARFAPPDPRCALWRRAAAERFSPHDGLAPRGATLTHLATPMRASDGDSGPSPDFRPGALALSLPRPTRAGRDGTPVILHVLHDWGGGVERFVIDQMHGDDRAIHLALVSHGDIAGGFGQRLSLYVDLAKCPIRTWLADTPVGDLAASHPTVLEALRETVASFGVSALRVSSLIGTSLDVLKTGLPTAYVIHDAYPFWPVLDDETPVPAWDEARIAAAAAAPGWLFATREPRIWRSRLTGTIDALAASDITLVAPSRSAIDRLARLLPPDRLVQARVIPHGIAGTGQRRGHHRREGRLRVLVPGRLVGGKGQRLLDALLPMAPGNVEWCFAGGGAMARAYADRTGGSAVEHYVPEDLAALVAAFDPDVALLPSLLPETFGYTLSEMQALGVPVLAAARGAYGERINASNNGLATVSPDPAAFAEQLAALAEDPARLPRDLPKPPDVESMRQAWRELQHAAARPPSTLPAGRGSIAEMQHARGMLVACCNWLRRERDAAYAAHDRDTSDLVRQRDIAVERMDSLAEERTRERASLDRLQAELDRATRSHEETRQRIGGLEARLEATEAEKQRMGAELDALRRDLGDAIADRDSAYGYYERDTADLIRQRDTALSQRDAANDQLAQAQRTLGHPLIRWPLAIARRALDQWAAMRYRAHRSTDLVIRGLRSLRSRGIAATLASARRRWHVGRAPEAPAPAVLDTPLCFAVPASVRTSVIIPVHGKLAYTLDCLRSLRNTGLPDDAEVIVIDDASPDETGKALPSIPGLRYHRNATNLGFVGSCNAGAALARGRHLVFLNNDTTLTPGWLDALLRTFDTHPDTGLAGAQLVYPDGRLQESGGIVFSDGSGWNYGRFEDPQHPAYTFVREVDYCSGAAIAIPRALFERLGGFDARYAPAYYEDTDLAMKVRDAGLKVRVQPASVVIHHEGITAGTDTGSGVKAYQLRNQQRFVERWRDTLGRRHPAPSQAPHYAAQHRARARVLVIDATTPMPDRDSGSLRLFELLRLLVGEGCAVTFFAENGLDDGRYTQDLRDIGVEAWTQPWLGAIPDWLSKNGPRFQLVIVSRHYILSPLLPLLRRHAPQARIVFDTVDLHHLREQREAEERGDAALLRVAARTRADELALIGAVDRTWVVSPVEKALLAETAPGAVVDVVSNIHRVRGAGPAMAARHGLIFVGGFRHPPNVDAALWFADEILPRIHARRPDITLSLVGSDAPPAILALGEREGITVHGHVPDLEPLIDAHRFSIAPLRYGAGVKGKINQALAHGLPVVATRCAVEGMGLADGVDALVADDAEAFAAAILAAYDDEALWQRLVRGGLANTEREFSPERARTTLRAIFSELR